MPQKACVNLLVLANFCIIVWEAIMFGEPVEPITKLKRLYLDTELVRDGAPCAVIYHPASPEYEAAAHELAQMLQERYGVRLPIKTDDAQRTWRNEKNNIIVLGNMGNSLLLRWLHYRGFFAPGWEVKRRIQTIHDPWADGRNIVALGGVDLENVKANFPHLLELLKTPRPRSVILPRTFEPLPPMNDYLKTRLEEFTKDLSRMHIRYAAYHAGWVCNYYARYGRDELVVLYRDCIRKMAEAKYYVHLYLFRECAAWDVIEESPALTDADRLMITNFFRNVVADENEGIGYVRSALRSKRLIQGNHPSQAACGVMVMADYLRKYYPSELHERWYREALSFFEPYRSKGCYLGDDEGMQGASIENIMNAVYATEDDPANHPFLRRTLDRLMPNYNNFGMWPAYGDQPCPYRFGANWYLAGARMYGNPEYLWMYHFINTASPTAPPKIPTTTESSGWWPLSIAPRQPKKFVGLQWAEPDETLFSLARPKWAAENNVKMEDCFGRAAFRAGISPQDDYLLLDGVHLNHAYDDQNGILEYSALGRTFLVSLDCDYGTKASAHNVVSVSVDGLADLNPSPLATRRLWVDLPSFAATRTVLYTDGHSDAQNYDCPSADWERNILWLKNKFFVVFDRVIARQEGLHSATAFWRMVGERRDLPDGIEMLHRVGNEEVRFRLVVPGVDGFTVGRERDPQATYIFTRYVKQPPPMNDVPPIIHMLKAHKAARLKPGESFTIATCFWVTSAQRPNEISVKQVSPNAVLIEMNREPMLATLGPLSMYGLEIDAEISLVSPKRVCLVAGRKLVVKGRVVFEAQTPASFEWAGERLTEDVSKALATLLSTLPAVSPSPQTHIPQAGNRLEIVNQRKMDSAIECMWSSDNTVLVGQRNGAVDALSADALKPIWTYRCAGVVNSIDSDGKSLVVIGSDDYHVHALSVDGKPLWKWQPPFDELKARAAYFQWLWPEPFVKKVVLHDINKDGKPEVIVGAGMNTFAADGDGKLLWAFQEKEDHHPSMRVIVFADVNNDGVEELIGGASDMWYVGSMWAVGPNGEELRRFASDGWCSGARVAIADDLMGKGKKGLAYGTRRGGVWCYPDVTDSDKRWYRVLGDQVDALAVLRYQNGQKLVAAGGGDSRWVVAFNPAGERVWAVYLNSAVRTMTSNVAQDHIYVACEDGTILEIDAAGRVLRSITLEGTPTVMLPSAGGVVVGTEQGFVYQIR